MYYLEGIKKIISSVIIITFIFTNTAYGAPNSLRPILKANHLIEKAAEEIFKEKTIPSNNDITREDIKEFTKVLRCLMGRQTYIAKSGHTNTSLPLAELYAALYLLGVLHFDIEDLAWEYRDRFHSAGHDYLSVYALDFLLGLLTKEELDGLRSMDFPRVPGHRSTITPLVEQNEGALGETPGHGIGNAIVAKMEKTNFHTTVVLGDGELQRPEVYTSIELAVNLLEKGQIGVITFVINWNKAQRDGFAKDFGTDNLEQKFEAFGCDVNTVDGHDAFAIAEVLKNAKKTDDKISVVIIDTVKGKGFSEMSKGKRGFMRHGTAIRNKEEYLKFLKEIGVSVTETDLKSTRVGDDEILVDDLETTLKTKFDMQRINKVIDIVKQRNAEYRRQIEKKELKDWGEDGNPHLKPLDLSWLEEEMKQKSERYKLEDEVATRIGVGQILTEIIEEHPELANRILIGTADLEESSQMHKAGAMLPFGRFQGGIREEVIVSAIIAASVASRDREGKPRIISIFSTLDFATNNVVQQLRMGDQTDGASFGLVMPHSGKVGDDGPTHHAFNTGEVVRSLDGFEILEPYDANSAADLLKQTLVKIAQGNARVYLKLHRGTQGLTKVYERPAGYNPLADSFVAYETEGVDANVPPDGIIVSMGIMYGEALEAAKKLEKKGRKVRVICIMNSTKAEQENSELSKLLVPGAPTVTAHDQSRKFLKAVVGGVVTDMPYKWGDKPTVISLGITDKGLSFRVNRGRTEIERAYAKYNLHSNGIAATMETLITSREQDIQIRLAGHKNGTSQFL
ncbi:MAG: hypothetical protein KKD11_03015 [Candidatus Omnitrophica bacterium]|nr:hypothetical protein [Candidatus Omnitrophota bacterium]